eukprot:1840578-Rhodomonas_salina.1
MVQAVLVSSNVVQGKRHRGAPQASSARRTGSYDWAQYGPWSKMLVGLLSTTELHFRVTQRHVR